MSDMHEIVDLHSVGKAFVVLAILLPILGVAIGAAVGTRQSNTRSGALTGLCWGLLGPLNWVLWNLYNFLTNRNGIDTVRNLVINLVIFVLVGAVIGTAAGFLSRPRKE